MSFSEIITYGITLLVILRIFFFFRKIYKNCIRKIVFPKKVLAEEREEERKNNELYKEKKHKELVKQQEELRKVQKDDERVYKENLEIVGVAKPVGKWTKMVMMSGNLMHRFLIQLINTEGDKKGFWELFIKAQSSVKGKHKGKGR